MVRTIPECVTAWDRLYTTKVGVWALVSLPWYPDHPVSYLVFYFFCRFLNAPFARSSSSLLVIVLFCISCYIQFIFVSSNCCAYLTFGVPTSTWVLIYWMGMNISQILMRRFPTSFFCRFASFTLREAGRPNPLASPCRLPALWNMSYWNSVNTGPTSCSWRYLPISCPR